MLPSQGLRRRQEIPLHHSRCFPWLLDPPPWIKSSRRRNRVLNRPTSVSSCPPRQNQEGSLAHSISYSSGVQGKGKASRPHTRTVRLPLPRAGPGSRQGCDAGTKVLTGHVQSACQASRSKPSANGGHDCHDCRVPSSLPGIRTWNSGRHQTLEDEEENGFFPRRAHSALPGSGAEMDAAGSSVFRGKAQPWRSQVQKPCLPLTAAPSANQPPQALSSASVLFPPDSDGLCCFTFDFLISASLGLYLRSFKIQQILNVNVGQIRYKLILDHVVNFHNKNYF